MWTLISYAVVSKAQAQALVKEMAVKRITVERQKHSWTKWELARRARIHPARVGQIENGRVIPYPVEVQRLAFALGIEEADADSLIRDVGDEAGS